MKYLFLTSMFPVGKESVILERSKGKPVASANDTFQKALIGGVADIMAYADGSVSVMNMPNIGAFPFNYSDLYYKGRPYRHKGISVDDISFINITYVKHIHKYHRIRKRLRAYLRENPDAVVICYDLYAPWMKALSELKREYGFRAVAIVPDLPNMTGTPDTLTYKISNRLPHCNVGKYMDVFDGYVLLVEKMAEALGISGKPHIVVEGIYNCDSVSRAAATDSGERYEFVIVYAGALSIRNGVDQLVEAVRGIPSSNLRLDLYGAGELVDFIKSRSASDPRISYCGQISHDALLVKLREADLLVNPRQPDKEFASYSFPSKTMEYMASGTTVLMYRLPSLPAEYHEHLYFINDSHDAESALKKAIRQVMDFSAVLRRRKGEQARNFILANKRGDIQARRIIGFSNSL